MRAKIPPPVSAAEPEFRQTAAALLQADFLAGNHVESLRNGREIFPSMLNAIRSARRTINLEPYIFWDGEVAREFTAALAERARAGVTVNVILDAQGSRIFGRKNRAQLRAAGVHLVHYHTLLWLDPRRYNNRSHRRLLIVDGRIGFVGGVGLADPWLGDGLEPKRWRENHYKVTGPVVAQLQTAFNEHWQQTKRTPLDGSEYFPPLAATGRYLAQAFKSSPRHGRRELHLMYLLAITGAKRSLLIENAYFLPDELLREELIRAARRGVKVEIIIPGGHIDYKIMRMVSRRHWPELLQAGVKLYEYAPAMMHVKLLIVDGAFVSVGSGNLDARSLQLNDEANLNVLDRRFAAEQTKLFEADKRRSREVTLKEARKVHPDLLRHTIGDLIAPEL